MPALPNLPLRLSNGLQMALYAAAILVSGEWAIEHGQTSMLLAALALSALYGIYSLNKRSGMLAMLLYLILLGDIRRIIGWLTSFPANDPMLLVGPAFVLLASLPIFFRLRLADRISKLVLGVLVMMILQIFNPGQGGLFAGLSGALFCVPPILWFWLGRTYGGPTLLYTVMYRIMVPMAVLAAMLGLWQVFFGVTPWQEAWVRHSAYQALYIGGNSVRSFGFFPSSSEYTNFMLMASIFCVAGLLLGRRIMLLPMAFLAPALVLASSRGAIIRLVLASVIMWALKSDNKATQTLRFTFAALVTVGALALLLSRYGNYNAQRGGDTQASYALAHQANGLAHPLNSKYSTAGIHSAEIGAGFISALKHPIGYGTGATNLGGAKFSEGDSDQGAVASEFDLSDEFISLGIPGGLIYVAIVISSIMVFYRYTRKGPKNISIPMFAISIAALGDWLFPGEYANGALFWFMLGCVVAATNAMPNFAKTASKMAAMPAYPARALPIKLAR